MLDFISFDPRNDAIENYRNNYPEFGEIDEFKDLKSFELAYVWFYSHPKSPITEKGDDRVKKCLQEVYGKNWEDSYKKYKTPDERIKLAINIMSRINDNVRMRAKMMVDKTFNDYEELMSVGIAEFQSASGGIDYKAFIDVRKTILKELQELVRIKERGFGISGKKGNTTQLNGQELNEIYLKSKHNS
jgi:hypothetical protein